DAAVRFRSEGASWNAIIGSSLDRAAETARIMADVLGIPMLGTRDDLVERDYGQLEGMPVLEARARFSVDGDLLGPGVESLPELIARAKAAIDAVAAEHPLDALLVVAHGTFIRSFADALAGFETPRISNGDAVHIEGTPGDWRITRLPKSREDAPASHPDRVGAGTNESQ
ncbi:MAG TPA: histidine phosphatase family protein, partial [Candidatus Agrococcus pullicola]|nr:histidine phosphatase family protein [Candidatus Agrococcus pullicola]